LFNFKDEIEDITDTSKQELKMSKQIKVVVTKWKEVQFELLKHKDTNISTLKLLEENFEALEEH
jgi:dynein heavy chain